MTTIKFRNAQFVCEAPMLNSASYTGVRWKFNLTWNSSGDYYSTFDPTTKLEVFAKIDSNPTWFNLGQLPTFNENGGYEVDLMSLAIEPKVEVTFKLLITNSGCNNFSNEIVIPM